ncbi:OLC1v1013491C1 [Oldenlandia corymbosa var. corymbosa]|uniref:OLC1v1013491C1 n=1 Tax=Oldenlandia corymbosa var. corymbosa TaxID=529605 RepID=A0AAV1DYR3_OLDCO|nr:OLC1v1013491C1 [Oldenlandia corymbosa var. corymbosa]
MWKFQKLLEDGEGETKQITNFDMAEYTGNYKSNKHKYKIAFMRNTRVEPCTIDSIPKHSFEFVPFDYVLTMNPINNDYLIGKRYVKNAKFGGKVFLDLDIDEFNSYRQRIKINVRVIDSTGCATFILWDKDVKHSSNRTTLELRRKQADMQKESLNDEDLYDYPAEINAMLNKQCLFKLDISPNYNPNMSADIKVAKMTDDPDIITEFMSIYKQDMEGVSYMKTTPNGNTTRVTEESKNVASQSGDNDHVNEDLVTTASSPVDKQKRCHREMSRENVLMVCQSPEPTTLSITSDLICVKFLTYLSIMNPTSGENVEVKLDSAPIWHANWEAVFGLSYELGEYVIIVLELKSDLNMHGKITWWDMKKKLYDMIVVRKDIQQLCPRVVDQGILVGKNIFWPIDKMIQSQVSGYKSEGVIVSYSIECEKFYVIPGPTRAKWDSDPNSSHRMINIIDLQGKLCISNPHYFQSTRHLQLWALEIQSPGHFYWDNVHDHVLEFQVARPLQPFPVPDEHKTNFIERKIK